MKYKVLSPLIHDGKFLAPDTEVELSDEAASPLIKDGTLEDPKGEAAKKVPVEVTSVGLPVAKAGALHEAPVSDLDISVTEEPPTKSKLKSKSGE